MNGRRLKAILILLILTGGFGGVSTPTDAHHLTVGEVLEILNREEVKARTGIAEAKVDPHLKRHLIIKVNDAWFKLPPSRREKLAAVWLQMWKDALEDGIVSVLELGSNDPVVNYSPSGQVSLVMRRKAPKN